MLASPMASYSVLDALGDLHLDPLGPSPSLLDKPARSKTFTRLTRTTPPAQSPASFLMANTLLPPTQIQRPSKPDTTPSTSTIGHYHSNKNDGIGSENSGIDKEASADTSPSGSGLDRFRASSSLLIQPSNDFLDNQPSTDPGQHFTTHRRFDRASAQKAALSFLQENNVLQPLSLPSEEQQPTVTRSKATFTRITKPRFNAFGSPKLGPSGSLLASGSRSNSISSINNDSLRSSSPSLQEDSASTSPSPSTSSPTSSLSPSPPLSSPAWSLRLEEPRQRPSIYHAPTKAQVPSLSLSLSPSFLSLPSAVPSLSPASSYSSSSCSSLSSLSSLSSSPSPPPTHIIFPASEDQHGWWQQRPVPSDLLCAEEGMKSGNDSLADTRQGSETGRLVGSPEEKHPPLLQGTTLATLSESEGETSPSHFSEKGVSSCDREKGETAESCCSSNNNSDLGCSGCPFTPLQQRRLNSRGFEQVRPRTTLQGRTRAPSPPSVITGFCSISSQGSSTSSGEPSPQDFLGEADLPYPVPSTLQERQARHRKRTEQLRQLKLREEREARETWRRTRRRGASFTAGIPPCDDNKSNNNISSSGSSCPQGRSKGRPLSLSLSSSWSNKIQHPSIVGAVRAGANHLKRSPSSPVAKGGNAAASTDKTTRRCVGFDLKRTKIIEYDAYEWSPCTISTPASRQDRDGGGYFDLCISSATSSLSGSDDDESNNSNDNYKQDYRIRDDGPRRYRRAATVYPGSKNFDMTL